MSDKIESSNEFLLRRLKKLQAQLEKAEKVIEFYGDSENWNGDESFAVDRDFETMQLSEDIDDNANIGGKKAREYFKEKEKNKNV